MINDNIKTKLENLFSDRVRFNQVERTAYSRDIGVLPESVKKTIDTMPDAVVQPISSEELIGLVKLARENRIPLVPRGSASSGYGGVIPTRGGIVVDFTRMKKILTVDRQNLQATVEPGAIWQEIGQDLAEHGLALRLYPTSAPSATVAGWVAQGGTGIGGYEYGFIKDNIEALTIVDPDGEERIVIGNDMEIFADMEGITGFIVNVTLKLRPLDQESLSLAAFPSVNQYVQVLKQLKDKQIPLWSVSLATPQQTAKKQKVTGHHILPEDSYIGFFVYPAARRDEITDELNQAIKSNGGRLLSKEAAEQEWADRFYPMRLKKLGPSLVVSEIIVPLNEVGDCIAILEKKYPEIAIEGFMVGRDHMTLLTFILADERDKAFSLVFTASLVILDMAKKYGGKIYSLGMFFTDEVRSFFEPSRLDKILEYKRDKDPSGIFNPGKVLPPSLDSNSPLKMFNAAIKAANMGKSVLSVAGKLLTRSGGNGYSKLPPELAWDAFACAQCGYCRSNCTVFDADPWETNSPRGKWNLLMEYAKGNLEMNEELSESMFFCTTCKRCDVVCQVNLPIVQHWLEMRPLLNEQEGLELSGMALIRDNVVNTGNFWGIPNENRAAWMTEDIKCQEKGEIAFWAGCWGSYVMTNMPQNTMRIMNQVGIDFTYFGDQETCCGLYHMAGGYYTELAEQIRKNIEMFKSRGVKTLLLTCPGCLATFTEAYPEFAHQLGLEWDIEVKHATVFLDELIKAGKLKMEIPLNLVATYHDSCHLGRWAGIYDQPRDIIKVIPGVEFREMEHNRENGLCCGAVASFNSMDAVAHIGGKRAAEAAKVGADVLVTACAGCGSSMNFMCNAMQLSTKQQDITDLICQAMGMEVMDSTANVAAFMTAAGDLMKTSRVVKRKVLGSQIARAK